MTRVELLKTSLLGSVLAISVNVAFSVNAVLSEQLPLMERGEAEMAHRDYDGAINSFTEALGFNMNNTAAYFKRGQCFYYQKKYVEALSDFEYMLKANPKDSQALLWTGTAHAKLGHEKQAIEAYVAAMRADPQLVAQYQKGKAQSGQKVEPVNPRNQGAVSAYERAVTQYLVENPSAEASAEAGNSAVPTPTK